MQNIAQRLRRVREALGITQSELADQMMYGRHYISLIERGKSGNPSRRFLEQLKTLEKEAEQKGHAEQPDASNDVYSHPPNGGIEQFSASRLNEDPPPRMSHPPHLNPAHRLSNRPDSDTGDEGVDQYTEAVHALGHLYDSNKQAFKTVLDILRRYTKN